MSQTISPVLEHDELAALAQRGMSTPSQLSAFEIARVCAALLRTLTEADDIILQARWRSPGTLLKP